MERLVRSYDTLTLSGKDDKEKRSEFMCGVSLVLVSL